MITAKLFIRGMKEPVELNLEEGRAAEALIADATQPKDTPFSVEGVWTGVKADMKFVAFPAEDTAWNTEKPLPMNDSDAEVFEEELSKYQRDTIMQDCPTYNTYDLWLKGIGAVTVERIEHPREGKDMPQHQIRIVSVLNHVKYAEGNKKWEAYRLNKARKEYIEKQKMKQLEEMAEQIGV